MDILVLPLAVMKCFSTTWQGCFQNELDNGIDKVNTGDADGRSMGSSVGEIFSHFKKFSNGELTTMVPWLNDFLNDKTVIQRNATLLKRAFPPSFFFKKDSAFQQKHSSVEQFYFCYKMFAVMTTQSKCWEELVSLKQNYYIKVMMKWNVDYKQQRNIRQQTRKVKDKNTLNSQRYAFKHLNLFGSEPEST